MKRIPNENYLRKELLIKLLDLIEILKKYYLNECLERKNRETSIMEDLNDE